MKNVYKKTAFPVDQARTYLEPGPIVLVSSQYGQKKNVMTMGWYTVMEFNPSLVGCMITAANDSFELIRKSGCCVINLPTYSMIETIIGIGNDHGSSVDKFKKYQLKYSDAHTVAAPVLDDCYANFECRLYDKKLLNTYNFFIFEVTYAAVAKSPKYPQTAHYRGSGLFMVSGETASYKKLFKRKDL